LRANLDASVLQSMILGVASSCDLQYFVEYLRSKSIFKDIRYNFELGSSDDASIEILRPGNVIESSDVAVFSVAETTKKLIHPLVQKKDRDHAAAFLVLEQRLRDIFGRVKRSPLKAAFVFKYPFDRSTLDISDRPWVKGSVSYWLHRIDDLYVELLSEAEGKIELLDIDEALTPYGFSRENFRQELGGGHPEPPGAEKLADLFLERLISRLDKGRKIKAIALDLDETLWKGVYLESDTPPTLHANRVVALYQHAMKGIPICVVSKNNPEDAARIRDHITTSVPGLAKNIVSYYVGWDPKSASIRRMASDLGIGLDTIAHFDDSEFERGEVSFACPQVRVYDETEIIKSLRYAEFSFPTLSADAKARVQTYVDNARRRDDEASHGTTGNLNDYLASLGFSISFKLADGSDIDRADELVQRTNQQNLLLNRTPRDQIARYIDASRCIMIGLEDKFGDYGTIGVCLYDAEGEAIRLQELAISCRALGKGVEECIVCFLSQNFPKSRSLTFHAKRNYKNESFFQKMLEGGFVFDESTSEMSLTLNQGSEFPAWFQVQLPGMAPKAVTIEVAEQAA